MSFLFISLESRNDTVYLAKVWLDSPSTLATEQVSHATLDNMGTKRTYRYVLRVINSLTHVSLLLKTTNGKQEQAEAGQSVRLPHQKLWDQ